MKRHILFFVSLLALLFQAMSAPPPSRKNAYPLINPGGSGGNNLTSQVVLQRSISNIRSLLDTNADMDVAGFELYLTSMISFTAKVWEKIREEGDDVALFYPISLNPVFETMSMIAVQNSGSWNEIRDLFGNEYRLTYPSRFPNLIHHYFKSMGVESFNVFYAPPHFQLPRELEQLSNQMDAPLVSNKEELKTIIDQETKGQLQDFELEIPANGIMFINLVSIQFSWLTAFTRMSESRPFYNADGSTTLTNYLEADISTPFYEKTNEYNAFELPFSWYSNHLTEEEKLNVPSHLTREIVAYVIYQFDETTQLPTFDGQLLKEVHEKLSTVYERDIHLTIPAFELLANFKFTEKSFPELLKKNNAAFPLIGPATQIGIQHVASLCADEEGVIGSALTAGSVLFLSAPVTYEPVHINHKFLVVLVDQKTGAPITYAEVTKAMPGKQKCQRTEKKQPQNNSYEEEEFPELFYSLLLPSNY